MSFPPESFPPVKRLLGLMAESRPLTRAQLSREPGCDAETIVEYLQHLKQLGLSIEENAAGEIVLHETIELLDAPLITSSMDAETRSMLKAVKVEETLDSTSSALQRMPEQDRHAFAMFAEHQSSGRGRRGRRWVSPFARNIYLSLGWQFQNPLAELGCLPLVVALAVSKALGGAGLEGHRVKWPNDLLLDGRKLSGCLVDIQSDNRGPCHAVIGVGINVYMPETEQTAEIDQAWTDLASHLPGLSRNRLAGLLLQALLQDLTLFAAQGFEPFRPYWQQMDGLYGRVINAYAKNQSILGTAVGINENGALLLDTGKETLSLHSGDVSLHKTSL